MPASRRSLSCQSALVTWNGIVDCLAPRRAALELDVGLARREAAGADVHPLGIEGVGERRADRHVRHRQARRKRSPHLAEPLLLARQLARRDAAEHQLARGRLHRPADRRRARPAENRPSGHSMRLRPVARPAKRMPRELEAVGEARQIDVAVGRVEDRPWSASAVPSGAIRYPNRAVPPYTRDVASVTSNFCGSHTSDPLQRLEPVVVHAGLGARERALQLAAALEQVERAGEVAVTRQPPALLRSKKISRIRGKCTRDRTRHVCSGQWPRSTSPVTCDREPSATSSSCAELRDPGLDRETRRHVGAHRQVVLDRHRAVREPRGALRRSRRA